MKRLVFAAFVVIIVCFLIATPIVNVPYIKNRLFNSDRIKGSFSFFVDDVRNKVTTANVKYDNDIPTTLPIANENFWVKGDKYGKYTFDFFIKSEKLKSPIKVDIIYMKTSKWDITAINILSKYNTTTDKLDVTICYKTLNSDNETFFTNWVTKSFDYAEVSDSGAQIQIGI